MWKIFPGCCAAARTATVSCTTTTRTDKTAVFFMPTSFVRRFSTNSVVAKSVIYGRNGTRFIEGEKAHCSLRLTCKTLQFNHRYRLVYLMGNQQLKRFAMFSATASLPWNLSFN